MLPGSRLPMGDYGPKGFDARFCGDLYTRVENVICDHRVACSGNWEGGLGFPAGGLGALRGVCLAFPARVGRAIHQYGQLGEGHGGRFVCYLWGLGIRM